MVHGGGTNGKHGGERRAENLLPDLAWRINALTDHVRRLPPAVGGGVGAPMSVTFVRGGLQQGGEKFPFPRVSARSLGSTARALVDKTVMAPQLMLRPRNLTLLVCTVQAINFIARMLH